MAQRRLHRKAAQRNQRQTDGAERKVKRSRSVAPPIRPAAATNHSAPPRPAVKRLVERENGAKTDVAQQPILETRTGVEPEEEESNDTTRGRNDNQSAKNLRLLRQASSIPQNCPATPGANGRRRDPFIGIGRAVCRRCRTRGTVLTCFSVGRVRSMAP